MAKNERPNAVRGMVFAGFEKTINTQELDDAQPFAGSGHQSPLEAALQ